jgi:hypothetical protein
MMTQCSITCGSQTVDCTCSPNSCSANGSTLICDGHTTTCSEVSSWQACRDGCYANRDSCLLGCGGLFDSACLAACQQAYLACFQSCGPNPASNTCG